MTLLETQTKPSIEAADSRFFMPEEFPPVDLLSLNILRSSIVARAKSMRQKRGVAGLQVTGQKVDPNIPKTFQQIMYQGIIDAENDEMHSEIADLNRSLIVGRGIFRVAFPARFTRHSHTYDSLLADYKTGASNDDVHVVEFPSDALNTAKVMPFGNDYHYEPLVDMRIHTSGDSRVKTYGADGIYEVPSVGSWHRFPLAHVELELIEESQR